MYFRFLKIDYNWIGHAWRADDYLIKKVGTGWKNKQRKISSKEGSGIENKKKGKK